LSKGEEPWFDRLTMNGVEKVITNGAANVHRERSWESRLRMEYELKHRSPWACRRVRSHGSTSSPWTEWRK